MAGCVNYFFAALGFIAAFVVNRRVKTVGALQDYMHLGIITFFNEICYSELINVLRIRQLSKQISFSYSKMVLTGYAKVYTIILLTL